jgi:hypothetical protein
LSAVADLPLISVNPCSSVAVSLAAGGLGPVCQVTSGVTHAAGSIASGAVGFGADAVLNALGSWVSNGASWLLGQIGRVISDTTTIDLGASWFTDHYRIMVALAGVVIVPMMLLGIMQSIYRQNSSALVRSVLVNVPLALLLTAVAVKLVQLGLAVTDDLSSAISQGAGLDSGHFLSSVALGLSNGSADGQPAAPAFVLFVGGLVVVFGALMVWIELLIRAASVYVAVLFLPLALASLAWPAIAHWCRRLVDTLVALVLGKFVIVAVLSLAAGALAGGSGSAGSIGSGGGFAAVLAGAALLMFAAFAPWALFKLLPFLEAGAVGHLESASRRAHQVASAPVKNMAHQAMGEAKAVGKAAVKELAFAKAGSGASDLVEGSVGGAGTESSGSPRSSGPPGGGGPTPGGTGGGDGPSSGGAGSSGARPDPGPSSAESTGAGTFGPPGSSVGGWPVNAKVSEALQGAVGDRPNDPDTARQPMTDRAGRPAAVDAGPDEAGVRLTGTPISAPSSPTPFPPPVHRVDGSNDPEGVRGD